MSGIAILGMFLLVAFVRPEHEDVPTCDDLRARWEWFQASFPPQ